MDLIYGIKDKPKFGQVILFAIQQLLAIMAATIAVPAAVSLKEAFNTTPPLADTVSLPAKFNLTLFAA